MLIENEEAPLQVMFKYLQTQPEICCIFTMPMQKRDSSLRELSGN